MGIARQLAELLLLVARDRCTHWARPPCLENAVGAGIRAICCCLLDPQPPPQVMWARWKMGWCKCPFSGPVTPERPRGAVQPRSPIPLSLPLCPGCPDNQTHSARLSSWSAVPPLVKSASLHGIVLFFISVVLLMLMFANFCSASHLIGCKFGSTWRQI